MHDKRSLLRPRSYNVQFSAVVLVIDVGTTSHSSGFLTSGIRCVTELLQRKLMAESTDRFGVVLAGSDKSDNPLNYKHVTLIDRGLSVADWGLMELVGKHIAGTYCETDWLDAVVVALHYLKENTDGNTKCVSKKIVLVSDLGCPSKDSNLDIIITNMKKEGVEFTFIGPVWDHEEKKGLKSGDANNGDDGSGGNYHGKPMTTLQRNNEVMVAQIIDATDGILCDVETAMVNFLYIERKSKKPFPWKVSIEIGRSLQVNAVGYIQVRREPAKTWKRCLARQKPGVDEDELKPEVTFVKNTENQEVIDLNNIIESYKYGSQQITVTDEDKANNKYEGGPKSMMVIGFIPLDSLQRQYFLGDGCMVFQPVENDEHANVALSALTHAMHESGVAALVRKVYRAGTSPRLGALIPEYKEEDDEEGSREMTLVFIELPYAEDVRDYTFAPIYTEKVKPSSEQLEAVGDMIDAMMLSTEGGKRADDLLVPESIQNPCYQHLYRCLAFRALKPGQVLPELADDIRGLLQPSQDLLNSAKDSLKRVHQLFPLEEIEKKKEKLTGDKLFAERGGKREREDDDEAEGSSNKRLNSGDLTLQRTTVTEVGTTSPADDFLQLLKDGEPLIPVAQQLEQVILKLLHTSFGGQMYGKICSCLQTYRSACLEKGYPDLFNDFIRELKHESISGKKEDLLKDIFDQNLGLISSDEYVTSKVDAAEAKSFASLHQEATPKENVSAVEEEADDDLLDEL